MSSAWSVVNCSRRTVTTCSRFKSETMQEIRSLSPAQKQALFHRPWNWCPDDVQIHIPDAHHGSGASLARRVRLSSLRCVPAGNVREQPVLGRSSARFCHLQCGLGCLWVLVLPVASSPRLAVGGAARLVVGRHRAAEWCGHPLWSLAQRSYTPGVATALILLPLALRLAQQLRARHASSVDEH